MPRFPTCDTCQYAVFDAAQKLNLCRRHGWHPVQDADPACPDYVTYNGETGKLSCLPFAESIQRIELIDGAILN